ncbi:MAG: DUF262 domain-containing protein, partial [Gluconobacter sp.]|uniref:DUF262 domain-containing protein n=1 Tax=Gluconobacter sp. TaxID=1876758 RepID=UPI0039EA1D8D
VPEYQREFVWDDDRQSKLVESIILGLPIPVIFLAENKNGRIEIVDGSQRIRTLVAFKADDLVLSGLETINSLNGLKFSDLPLSRQRKINNYPLRVIVLSDSLTEEIKSDLFERINKGSDILRNMEKRKGIYHGKFTDFIYKRCAVNPILIKMTPLANSVKNRQEIEELILRYFAFLEKYPNFNALRNGVSTFLDDFMSSKNTNFTKSDEEELAKNFDRTIQFVNKSFPFGFAKRSNLSVSRVYFEAIAVGTALALKEKPNLSVDPINVGIWMQNTNFRDDINGKTRTHSAAKLSSRITFVRDRLLEAAK